MNSLSLIQSSEFAIILQTIVKIPELCSVHQVFITIRLIFKNREKFKKKVNPWGLRLRNTCAIGRAKKTAKTALIYVNLFIDVLSK